ncbi:PEP-CTERM sorting domain-containing protein [Thalassotalea litorea]|uniref:PEP-CTERM sorting domain-containing protein n=1 Tax=Thalassotalea litorea TaxID=2020715 RepID=UPI003736F043
MNMFKAVFAGVVLLISGFASAGEIVDIKEHANNTETEYFVDFDSNKYMSPYYRNGSQDWEWMHSAIAGTFSNIFLDISAFDVDFGVGEYDEIYVFNGVSWVSLGYLEGFDDQWVFTRFDLSGYEWANEQVNAGLKVRVDIDASEDDWLVTMGKSILTLGDRIVDDVSGCVPTPGVPCTSVPESPTLAILGLACLGIVIRRFNRD